MVEQEPVTIPAQVVELLRGALYYELTRACEDMPDTMPKTRERAGWADVLARIDGARDALDLIEWDAPAEQRDVTLVLDATMIEALEDDADLWDWLSHQEKTESAEGRERARARADTIEQFLAAVAEHPSPTTPQDGDT
ncbi:MAG: hypothetical protein WBQ21_11645 [Solirubrobacteraceae bacterium]